MKYAYRSDHAYRSEYQQVVDTRIEQMRTASELAKPLIPKLRSIRAARIARIFAGSVGILGVLASCLVGATDLREELTYTFLGSLAATIATYITVRMLMAIGGLFTRKKHEALSAWSAPQLTGQLGTDLETIDSSNGFRAIERKLNALELWSTSLPLIALSLLTPLTLHWLFVLIAGSETASDYSKWIRISFVVVGHAHLALAYMCYRFAKKMRNQSLQEIQNMRIHSEWAKTWAITIGVSCVPFILLFAVPPILVAITGIAFIPIMFLLMRHRIMAERGTLTEMEAATTIHTRIGTSGLLANDNAKMFGEASWTDLMNPHLRGVRGVRGIDTIEVDAEPPAELNSLAASLHSPPAGRA